MYVVRRCKFDLRVYVLLTGVDPLKIYVYDEGLVRFDQKLQRLYYPKYPIVRFATNEFTLDPDKIKDNRIHVTNFDVNKVKEVMIVHFKYIPLMPKPKLSLFKNPF